MSVFDSFFDWLYGEGAINTCTSCYQSKGELAETGGGFTVTCPSCHSQVSSDESPEDAIYNWNDVNPKPDDGTDSTDTVDRSGTY